MPGATESRVDGLFDVRRWLIRLLFTEAWLFAALAGLVAWGRLTSLDRAALAAGAALLVVGWASSRRTVGLWLITAAPLVLVLATAVSRLDPGPARWIALGVSIGHVAYGVVLLTSRVIGAAGIAVCCSALVLVWSQRPSNVVPGSLDVAGGWISVVSLALSALVLWYVWHGLLDQARWDDTRRAEVSARLEEEVQAQERSRLWRSTVVSVHERLLSTLRYLLQADNLDRTGLRRLAEAATADASAPASALSEDLREATAARIAAGIVRVDSSVLDLPLGDDERAAARAAIVECALNAVLHGHATDVLVSARLEGDWCVIRVSDDGVGIAPHAKPGLGWTTTLDEGLATVGASWSISRSGDRTVATLRVPAVTDRPGAEFAEDGFAQGRILISAPLVVVGMVGVAYDVIAGVASPSGWPLIVTAVLATVGAVTIVAGRRAPSFPASSAVILGLAAVPWLAALFPPGAGAAPAAIAGITTAGYALIAVGVWSRWWQWTAGLLLWAGGVVLDARLGAGVDQDPLPIVVALVNCLVIVPVVVVVSSIGARRFQRSQAALALEREAMNRELSRANSAIYIDQHLSACVAQADDIISQLAAGADLDDGRRLHVACLEGLIRATIQVDPVDSGEFTRAAARLVNSAFSVSVPAHVGTLVSSTDRTVLEPEVLVRLESLIPHYESITVRTFSDGTADHLSLALHRPLSPSFDPVAALRDLNVQDLDVDVINEPDGSVIVVVSRRLPAFA
ncbi:MAG: hypothetical protein ACKOT0_12555 [bacterium]